MTPKELWLDAMWQHVRPALPAPPARVVEIGCGPLGGFVPRLADVGYAAAGVDPEAPEEPGFHRVEFERYEPPEPVDAIVACTSLHHVTDLAEMAERVHAALRPGGVAVIIEWARERFDEPTARWVFSRLPELPEQVNAEAPGGDAARRHHDHHGDAHDDAGWLHQTRDDWAASGLDWAEFVTAQSEAEHLHPGQDVIAALDARLRGEQLSYGPYYFSELAATSEADEQAAIDAGQIRANRIWYVGRRG
jgi:SAM-dependent methyltransferase